MKNTLSPGFLFLLLSLSLAAVPAHAQVNLGTSSSSTNPQRSGDATTGLSSPASGAVAISSAGTEVMRVTGSSVGIGTTSPLSQLDVVTSSTPATRGIASYQYGSGNLAALLTLYRAGGTPGSPTAVTTGGYGSGINMDAYDGSTFLDTAGVSSHINGTITTGSVPQDLILYTTGGANDGDPYANGHVRMDITSGGNVGIGTTAPTSLLHTVDSSAQTATYIGIEHAVSATSSTASVNKTGVDIQSTGTWNGTSAVNIGLNVNATGGTTNYAALFNGGDVGIGTTSPTTNTVVVYENTNNPIGIDIVNPNTGTNTQSTVRVGNTSTPYMGVFGWSPSGSYSNGDAFVYATSGLGLRFYTNGNCCAGTQMIITSSGSVGIGTTSPSYTLQVNGSVAGTSAYVNTSDIRYKKHIQPLVAGLKEVTQLKPVTFEWKTARDDGMQGQQIGFVAQDVEKILPSIVLTENNAEKTKGMKYSELIPVLVKAIQEQQTEIDELKQSVAQLKQQRERLNGNGK